MVPVTNMHIDNTGSLIVDSIKPPSQSTSVGQAGVVIDTSKTKVHLSSASLTEPVISGGTFTTVESIQTRKLEVTGTDSTTEIAGSVTVGGGLTVTGTVAGSGPYMDSSDIRYKRDVRKISQALKSVLALEGVRPSVGVCIYMSMSMSMSMSMYVCMYVCVYIYVCLSCMYEFIWMS